MNDLNHRRVGAQPSRGLQRATALTVEQAQLAGAQPDALSALSGRTMERALQVYDHGMALAGSDQARQAHTAATLLKRAGVPDRDIQHILGHAHVTTTQQIYQHSDQGLQADALDALSRMVLQQTAAETAADSHLSTGQGTKIPALTPGAPGRIRTSDTWFRSPIEAPWDGRATPVSGPPETAPGGLKWQQTAAEIAAALASLHVDEAHPHATCPLGHGTDWLLRELADRLGHEIPEPEGRGDLAA